MEDSLCGGGLIWDVNLVIITSSVWREGSRRGKGTKVEEEREKELPLRRGKGKAEPSTGAHTHPDSGTLISCC